MDCNGTDIQISALELQGFFQNCFQDSLATLHEQRASTLTCNSIFGFYLKHTFIFLFYLVGLT